MNRRTAGYGLWCLIIGAMFILTGCGKPPAKQETPTASYDPRKDPLVNPPRLFEPPPEDRSLIDTDDTLYIRLNANPNTLNPLFVSSHYDFMVVDVLFTGLYTFGKDLRWRLNEETVESFEESDDHTEFVVKMKPGFKWHDGQPLTAHDVAYSWKQILDPQVPCQTQKPTTEPITECVAPDDYTVKYVQNQPLATRHWNLVFPTIPKHVFEKDKAAHPDLKTGEYYQHLARQPIGSGAYRLVEWKENSQIIVERVEDYPGKKPYFKRIVFRIVPDDNVALLTFEKQQVDVVDDLDARKFAFETNSEAFARIGCKAWAVQWLFAYIGYNMDGSNPFFGDVRVRKAMSHALDAQTILDKVFFNLATRAHGIYHPDSWMYNPDVALIEYDLERAAALLDEAGWAVDPSEGWRYKQVEGARVPFEFTVLIPRESPYSPKIAAIWQASLKRLGVRVDTQLMEWSSFLEKTRNHEFQAEIAAWGTGTDPDTNWNLFRTDQYETGRNYGGYSNPKVDELFERGREAFDFEARRKIYQEIGKLIYDDQPYTFIYNRPILAVFNRRIHGVQFSPRGIFGFNPSHGEWWTPAGQASAAMTH